MLQRQGVRWGSLSGCSSDTTWAASDSTHSWGTCSVGAPLSWAPLPDLSPGHGSRGAGGLEKSQRGWHGRVCGGVLSQRWICCICLQACACLRIRSRQAARTLLSLSLTVCTSSAGLAGCFFLFYFFLFFFFLKLSEPSEHSGCRSDQARERRSPSARADSTEGQRDQLHSAVRLSVCLPACLSLCLHRHFSEKSNTTHFLLASFSRQIRYLSQREEEVAAEQQQQQLAPC